MLTGMQETPVETSHGMLAGDVQYAAIDVLRPVRALIAYRGAVEGEFFCSEIFRDAMDVLERGIARMAGMLGGDDDAESHRVQYSADLAGLWAILAMRVHQEDQIWKNPPVSNSALNGAIERRVEVLWEELRRAVSQ
jgi:hypothetical protein